VKVDPSDIQVGDIVFFDTYKKNGHVGIYVGNGKFIGSQSATGVAIADMSSGYFKKKFHGVIRRVSGGGHQKTIAEGNADWEKDNSNYTNTWKTKRESSSAKSYPAYKKHMTEAMSKGLPNNWANAMTELVGRESTWNPNRSSSKNSKSSAWGYAQFLDSTRREYKRRYPNLDYNKPTDQLILMYHYIKDRYGSPEAALKYWDKHNYY
jgi:hypothetical protein